MVLVNAMVPKPGETVAEWWLNTGYGRAPNWISSGIAFQRRVVRERLGIALDEMPGGHLLALSRPIELAGLEVWIAPARPAEFLTRRSTYVWTAFRGVTAA